MSDDIDAKKVPTPYDKRSTGRPKGKKDSLPRKPRARLDVKKRRKLINELKNCGSISHASALAGVSRYAVYNHMKNDPEFKRMIEEARDVANGTLEEYAYRRVIDGEKTIKRDGDGNIVETIEKPASAALVARLLDATDTYKKETNNHVHIHQNTDNSAILKLAQALGVSIDNDDIDKYKEAIDAEYTKVEGDD